MACGGFSKVQRWAVILCAMIFSSQSAATDSMNACSVNVSSYAPKQFVFVHGMGGGAWFWFEVETLLRQSGFNTTAVDLTSHGINKAVADNVTTVTEYTRPLIDAIAAIPGQVILVGHSLGGGSIAYASEKFPTKISKAIYLSACMPSNSQSMFGAFPNTTFPRLLNGNDLTLNFANGPSMPSSASLNLAQLDKFYMSATPQKYINLAINLMTPTPYVMGVEPLTLTASNYGQVRRFYIRTGKDLGVLTSEQDLIIAANPPERVFNMSNGDHAVFFSDPFTLFRTLLCISSL